jgi:S-formylglutathione hydrolase FrmB
MRFRKRNGLFLAVSLFAVGVAAWTFLAPRRPSHPVEDHPRLAAGVEMRDIRFFSESLYREMQYRVFAPANAGKQTLAVVYLLHGGGDEGLRSWSNDSDVAQFASRGLFLVMPQGDYSYYVNAALSPHDRYEDYIIDDLVADVARRFPVRDDRSGRAIVGVSMGGFGAINLALRHPDRFAFAGALSPAIDAPHRRFTWRRLDQSRHFREIFGAEDSDSRRDNDPFALARKVDPTTAPYFYMTCGQREGLMAPNHEFAKLLDRYGIAHEFHAVPGGHDWNQWNAQLAALFESLANHLDIPPRR